jgi:hypothetical protein
MSNGTSGMPVPFTTNLLVLSVRKRDASLFSREMSGMAGYRIWSWRRGRSREKALMAPLLKAAWASAPKVKRRLRCILNGEEACEPMDPMSVKGRTPRPYLYSKTAAILPANSPWHYSVLTSSPPSALRITFGSRHGRWTAARAMAMVGMIRGAKRVSRSPMSTMAWRQCRHPMVGEGDDRLRSCPLRCSVGKLVRGAEGVSRDGCRRDAGEPARRRRRGSE